MKIIKRIISLVLILVMVMSLFSGCSGRSINSVFVTRGEWAKLLATYFGMDDYQESVSYFDDVKMSSPYFDAVQACTEWNLFDEPFTKYEPDKFATVEFIVKTAARAAEVNTDDEITYALETELLPDSKKSTLRNYATLQQAFGCLDWAVAQLDSKEFVEYENVVVREDVKNLTDKEVQVSEDTIVTTEKLSVGEVIIAPPTPENPAGVAMKITNAIQNADGTISYEYTEPELGEVVEDFEVAAHAVPSVENVILSDGVTLVSSVVGMNSNSASNTDLVYREMNNGPVQTGKVESADLNFKINFTTGKITVDPNINTEKNIFDSNFSFLYRDEGEKEALRSYLHYVTEEDKEFGEISKYGETVTSYKKDGKAVKEKEKVYHDKNGHEKRIYSKSKYTAGYEIIGELGIKNIYANVEVKTKKVLGIPVGIDYSTIELNFDIASSLSVKGKLEGEWSLCVLPIALGPTGITLDLEFKLYAGANGELKVGATLGNNVFVESYKGNTKKTNKTTHSVTAEGSVTLEFGVGAGATVKLLGIKIIDATAKAGGEIDVEGKIKYSTEVKEEPTLRTTTLTASIETTGTLYVPIVKLELGSESTLAGKIGIKGTWTLVGKTGGITTAKAIPLEFFNHVWPIWSDTVEVPIDEEETEQEDAQGQDENADATENHIITTEGIFMLDKYYISIEEGSTDTISIEWIPNGYFETDFVFMSDKPRVATVSEKGVITAVGEGTAVIKAYSRDGKYSGECAVNVTKKGTGGA